MNMYIITLQSDSYLRRTRYFRYVIKDCDTHDAILETDSYHELRMKLSLLGVENLRRTMVIRRPENYNLIDFARFYAW